jgi:hypothetical protein
MTRKNKPAVHVRATSAHRPTGRMLAIILFATMAMSGAFVLGKPAMAADPDPAKVVGRWMRTDGGYVLQLSNPTFDGRLTAAYFNPRPINVSRSGWKLEEGYLLVLVELRDEGYPGSAYTLAYQPDTDRLVGLYYQAAAQQKFDVVFERIK